MGRFVQGDGDPELASRVATLAGARRASLQALGLSRVAKEVTLSDYLNQRDASEDRARDANASDPDRAPADTPDAGP